MFKLKFAKKLHLVIFLSTQCTFFPSDFFQPIVSLTEDKISVLRLLDHIMMGDNMKNKIGELLPVFEEFQESLVFSSMQAQEFELYFNKFTKYLSNLPIYVLANTLSKKIVSSVSTFIQCFDYFPSLKTILSLRQILIMYDHRDEIDRLLEKSEEQVVASGAQAAAAVAQPVRYLSEEMNSELQFGLEKLREIIISPGDVSTVKPGTKINTLELLNILKYLAGMDIETLMLNIERKINRPISTKFKSELELIINKCKNAIADDSADSEKFAAIKVLETLIRSLAAAATEEITSAQPVAAAAAPSLLALGADFLQKISPELKLELKNLRNLLYGVNDIFNVTPDSDITVEQINYIFNCWMGDFVKNTGKTIPSDFEDLFKTLRLKIDSVAKSFAVSASTLSSKELESITSSLEAVESAQFAVLVSTASEADLIDLIKEPVSVSDVSVRNNTTSTQEIAPFTQAESASFKDTPDQTRSDEQEMVVAEPTQPAAEPASALSSKAPESTTRSLAAAASAQSDDTSDTLNSKFKQLSQWIKEQPPLTQKQQIALNIIKSIAMSTSELKYKNHHPIETELIKILDILNKSWGESKNAHMISDFLIEKCVFVLKNNTFGNGYKFERLFLILMSINRLNRSDVACYLLNNNELQSEFLLEYGKILALPKRSKQIPDEFIKAMKKIPNDSLLEKMFETQDMNRFYDIVSIYEKTAPVLEALDMRELTIFFLSNYTNQIRKKLRLDDKARYCYYNLPHLLLFGLKYIDDSIDPTSFNIYYNESVQLLKYWDTTADAARKIYSLIPVNFVASTNPIFQVMDAQFQCGLEKLRKIIASMSITIVKPGTNLTSKEIGYILGILSRINIKDLILKIETYINGPISSKFKSELELIINKCKNAIADDSTDSAKSAAIKALETLIRSLAAASSREQSDAALAAKPVDAITAAPAALAAKPVDSIAAAPSAPAAKPVDSIAAAPSAPAAKPVDAITHMPYALERISPKVKLELKKLRNMIPSLNDIFNVKPDSDITVEQINYIYIHPLDSLIDKNNPIYNTVNVVYNSTILMFGDELDSIFKNMKAQSSAEKLPSKSLTAAPAAASSPAPKKTQTINAGTAAASMKSGMTKADREAWLKKEAERLAKEENAREINQKRKAKSGTIIPIPVKMRLTKAEREEAAFASKNPKAAQAAAAPTAKAAAASDKAKVIASDAQPAAAAAPTAKAPTASGKAKVIASDAQAAAAAPTAKATATPKLDSFARSFTAGNEFRVQDYATYTPKPTVSDANEGSQLKHVSAAPFERTSSKQEYKSLFSQLPFSMDPIQEFLVRSNSTGMIGAKTNPNLTAKNLDTLAKNGAAAAFARNDSVGSVGSNGAAVAFARNDSVGSVGSNGAAVAFARNDSVGSVGSNGSIHSPRKTQPGTKRDQNQMVGQGLVARPIKEQCLKDCKTALELMKVLSDHGFSCKLEGVTFKVYANGHRFIYHGHNTHGKDIMNLIGPIIKQLKTDGLIVI